MLLFFQEPVQKTLGTTLSSQGGGRTRRRLFKTHSFCFIPFIQNVVALLSNDSLRKTMLEAKCKNANGKFEYIQDGAVLSNHPLFSRIVLLHLKLFYIVMRLNCAMLLARG